MCHACPPKPIVTRPAAGPPPPLPRYGQEPYVVHATFQRFPTSLHRQGKRARFRCAHRAGRRPVASLPGRRQLNPMDPLTARPLRVGRAPTRRTSA